MLDLTKDVLYNIVEAVSALDGVPSGAHGKLVDSTIL